MLRLWVVEHIRSDSKEYKAAFYIPTFDVEGNLGKNDNFVSTFPAVFEGTTSFKFNLFTFFCDLSFLKERVLLCECMPSQSWNKWTGGLRKEACLEFMTTLEF